MNLLNYSPAVLLLTASSALLCLILSFFSLRKTIRFLFSVSSLISLAWISTALISLSSPPNRPTYYLKMIRSVIALPDFRLSFSFLIEPVPLVLLFFAILIVFLSVFINRLGNIQTGHLCAVSSLLQSSFILLFLSGSMPMTLIGWSGITFCTLLFHLLSNISRPDATERIPIYYYFLLSDLLLFSSVIAIRFKFHSFEYINISRFLETMPNISGNVPGLLICLGLISATAIKMGLFPFFSWVKNASHFPIQIQISVLAATVPASAFLLLRCHTIIQHYISIFWIPVIISILSMFVATLFFGFDPEFKRGFPFYAVFGSSVLFFFIATGQTTPAAVGIISNMLFMSVLIMSVENTEKIPFRIGILGITGSIPSAGFVLWVMALSSRAEAGIHSLFYAALIIPIYFFAVYQGVKHTWNSNSALEDFSFEADPDAKKTSPTFLSGLFIFLSVLFSVSFFIISFVPDVLKKLVSSPWLQLSDPLTMSWTDLLPAGTISCIAIAGAFLLARTLWKKHTPSSDNFAFLREALRNDLWIDAAVYFAIIVPIRKIGDIIWAFDSFFNNVIFTQTGWVIRKWSDLAISFNRWFFHGFFPGILLSVTRRTAQAGAHILEYSRFYVGFILASGFFLITMLVFMN